MKNVEELLGYWRSQVVDTARPYLWSDDDALVYAGEAERQFCRLTEGIPDFSTPEVVKVQITTDEIMADVHPSILTFRQAVLVSTGYPLDILNHTEIRRWNNTAGSVTGMIVGLEDGKVRWNRTPVVDDEVELLVFRLPLTEKYELTTEFEIDARHHPCLAHWMSYLAYLKQDTETFDAKASERAGAIFTQYCNQVSGEQRRYRQKPRAVAYGGI